MRLLAEGAVSRSISDRNNESNNGEGEDADGDVDDS